jgi:hypothetical protein
MAFFSQSDDSVTVAVKSTSDTAGIDNTTRSVGELESATGGGAKSAAVFGIVAGAAQVGVQALGGAIKSAATAAIGGAASFEQNRVAFETMLGSADKARTLMQQISDFAKSTPFQLPEVVQASKQLLAFGFAQDEIIPEMRKLGDVASGVGVPVGQLSAVFGQVRTAGKLMGQDLLQFTAAGVPLLDYLAQTMHKTTAQIKKDMDAGAGPSFQDVQKALDAMTDSGSKFGGMMDKQSHTLAGMWSNIQDGFGGLLRAAVGMTSAGDIIQGGLFDRMEKGVQVIMPFVQSLAQNIGPVMVKATGMFFDGMGKIVTVLKKVGDVFAKYPILSASGLGALALVIGVPLVTAFTTWAISAAAAAAATLLAAAPLILIGAAIGALVFLVVSNWDTIKKAFETGVNWVVDKFNYLKDNFWSIIGEIIGFWATLPIKIPELIIEAIVNVASWLASFKWSDIWSGLWQSAKDVASNVWQAIQGAWKAIIGLDWGGIMVNVGKGIANAIISLINGAIKGAFSSVPILKDHIPQIPHFAHGVRNFNGGLAVVGDVNGMGGEIVDLPRGANVFSNSQSKQMMGGGSTYHIQQVILQGAEATDEFFKIQDRNSVLASKGMSVVRAGA